jgi:hypothetical protein
LTAQAAAIQSSAARIVRTQGGIVPGVDLGDAPTSKFIQDNISGPDIANKHFFRAAELLTTR